MLPETNNSKKAVVPLEKKFWPIFFILPTMADDD